MSRPLVVLRPEPGAGATAERARAMGLDTRLLPLFAIEPVEAELPIPDRFDAVLVTSANGARHGQAVLAVTRALPLFAVGEATAGALRQAGFDPVVGGGTVAATLPAVAAQGHRRVLHVCGADIRAADVDDLHVERLIVYRAAARDDAQVMPMLVALPPAVLLVHSPRAGDRLAALLPAASRPCHEVVAVSAAAAEAAGQGWGGVHVAHRPEDMAMLALAAELCQNGVGNSNGSRGVS